MARRRKTKNPSLRSDQRSRSPVQVFTIGRNKRSRSPEYADDFKDITQYIKWNTIGGSLHRVMRGEARPMQINLRLPGMPSQVTLNSDFELPMEQPDLKMGTSSIIKMYGPYRDTDAGTTSDGRRVSVDFLGLRQNL